MEIKKFETQPYLNSTKVILFFFPELAEILFVDTTPFVKAYFTDAEGHTYDWRGIKSPKAYISNLLKVYYNWIHEYLWSIESCISMTWISCLKRNFI